MAIIKCPECGKEISDKAPTCIHCGFPLDAGHSDVEVNGSKTDVAKKEEHSEKKKQSKSAKATWIPIVVLSLIGVLVYSLVLWGEDEIAYRLIINNAYCFKDPSSIRVISGTAGMMDDGEEYAYYTISAKNSYGALTTDYYEYSDKWGIDKYEPISIDTGNGKTITIDNTDLCQYNGLNVWKINLRLRIHWLLTFAQ